MNFGHSGSFILAGYTPNFAPPGMPRRAPEAKAWLAKLRHPGQTRQRFDQIVVNHHHREKHQKTNAAW
jgi:hypothetical protein